MISKFCVFLLLYLFIFLVISYLFDLFFTIWLANSSRFSSSSSSSSLSQLPREDNALVSLLNLSLNQLKLILGLRGIYYVNNVSSVSEDQKRERLIELIRTSGQVTRDEQINIESSTSNNNENDCDTKVKFFSSAKLMEEEIDDNHVWLLYVRQEEHEEEILERNFHQDWSKLVKRFHKFNFRFARFDCASDPLYCHQRRWFSSQLVFAFPRTGVESMDKKILYNYSLRSNALNVDNIIHWLQRQLETQLTYISNNHDLESNWLSHQLQRNHLESKNLVKMIAIMGEQFRGNSPLTLPLLALQFSGKVQFGIYFASAQDLANLHSRFQTNINSDLPIYLFYSQQQVETPLLVYNANNYEPLSYLQTDAYLRGLVPELNDIYLALFSLANLCIGLNFFWTRCLSTGKHLRLWLLSAIELNLTLTCGMILAPVLLHRVSAILTHLPLHEEMISLLHQTIYSLQTIWSCEGAFYVRTQLFSPFAFERYLLTFFIAGIGLISIRRRFSRTDYYDDEAGVQSVFRWTSNVGYFVGLLLFRNTTRRRRVIHHHHTSSNSVQGESSLNVASPSNSSEGTNRDDDDIGVEYEEEFEDEENALEYIDLDADLDRLLMESLFTMPNLWLQTELISSDYLHQLPVWQYIEPVVKQCHFSKGDQEDIVNNNSNQYTSNSSATSDSSDNEECPILSQCIQLSSSSSSFSNCHQSIQQETESCCAAKSSKEAPETCCFNITESCSKTSSKNPPNFSPQLREKIEEKKRKIIRMRRKRSKRIDSNEIHRGQTNTYISTSKQKVETTKTESTKPVWMLDFHDCTICLDSYSSAQTITGLPCGHNYHQDCIVQWLTRGAHCCPICRWPSYRLKHSRQANKCN